ncbi:cobaltochelatase CobN subunit domain protein [Mycobacterium xenopi 3993]|nr:cobaltochelatase CobN subunit domain protein [Mycobacterium xenopi 3993]
MQLIDSRNWRDDADLAQVYTAWADTPTGATWMADLRPTT